jgi:hypothetical protein
MPTASNAKAERFWPAVPEHIWDSIREEFTLPTAADLETHFQSLDDPEAMRRAVRYSSAREPSARASSSKTGSSTNLCCASLTRR